MYSYSSDEEEDSAHFESRAQGERGHKINRKGNLHVLFPTKYTNGLHKWRNPIGIRRRDLS